MSNNIKKAWSEVGNNYSKLIVPNRPSVDDCRIYGKLIAKALKGKKNPKVVIMGSTPELRRILYTAEYLQGAEVICIDANKNMYGAMTNFVMPGNHFSETFLQKSWLDTGIESRRIDLVVGDEVICNVPSKNHGELFREISRILKPNGRWITRHNFFTQADRNTSVKKILKNVASGVADGSFDFQYAINLLLVSIFYYCGRVDHLNNSMTNHLKLFKKEYEVSFKNGKLGKIIKELINIYNIFFVVQMADYKWYVLSEAESKEELKELFIIETESFAKDYPTVKNSPIFQLKKEL